MNLKLLDYTLLDVTTLIDNMLFLPWHISYFELFQFCNDYKYITLSDFKGQCYVT